MNPLLERRELLLSLSDDFLKNREQDRFNHLTSTSGTRGSNTVAESDAYLRFDESSVYLCRTSFTYIFMRGLSTGKSLFISHLLQF